MTKRKLQKEITKLSKNIDNVVGKRNRKAQIGRKACIKCNSIWVYVNKDGTVVCRKCGHREEPK